MSIMSSNKKRGIIARRLDLGHFNKLVGEFSEWRMDPNMRDMEANKSAGRVHPFVRGLKLSAGLIYAIRDVLSSTDLEASWGHLLDENGSLCSPECDVIVHTKGHHTRWNGTEKPVMDFKFIEYKAAVAVISCKSFLRSVDKDIKDYSNKMRRYVKNLWLFAECCRPGTIEKLEDSAKKAGYNGFWYLYTWDKKAPAIVLNNDTGWEKFLEKLKKLGQSKSKSK